MPDRGATPGSARVVVSRKTPVDGRLEIPPGAWERLVGDGRALRVRIGASLAPAVLESVACSCAKAATSGHEHHFIACDLLRSLTPGSEVTVSRAAGSDVLVIASA